MKRYMIKYQDENSQTTYHSTFALGEDELKEELENILNSGAMIEWIGSRDSLDNIGYFHEEYLWRINIIKELGFKEKQDQNEDKILTMWGY